MIITVIAVAMVQSSVDQVIDMIAVWHKRMATPVVSALARYWCASIGIVGAHSDHVLVVVPLVWVVQMPVVQVIHMPLVEDANVPAVFTVNMGMRFVDGVCHGKPPFIRQTLQMRPIS